MRLTAPPRRRARIEIIPLIDVVFFLLATFVMVSLSMVKNRGLPVHLPAAATAALQDRRDSITLTVTAAGDFFFDQTPISAADLPRQLHTFKAAHAEPQVLIRADREAIWERAVGALDAVRASGIIRVAIETGSPRP